METERKCNKYVKAHLNAKTGAVIGGLSSLVLSTIIVATYPELREMPMEDKVRGITFITSMMTLVYVTAFHVMGWGIKKIDKYFESDKVDAYFDRLARR